MILVQILVGDLYEGHPGVRWRNPRSTTVFLLNSRLKIATNVGLVSLYLFCQDASTDMQHDLLGSTRDLTWPWPEAEYWPDHAMSPGKCFDAPWQEEHDGARIRPLTYLVRKLFAKKTCFEKKTFFAFFFTSSGWTVDVSSNLMDAREIKWCKWVSEESMKLRNLYGAGLDRKGNIGDAYTISNIFWQYFKIFENRYCKISNPILFCYLK